VSLVLLRVRGSGGLCGKVRTATNCPHPCPGRGAVVAHPGLGGYGIITAAMVYPMEAPQGGGRLARILQRQKRTLITINTLSTIFGIFPLPPNGPRGPPVPPGPVPRVPSGPSPLAPRRHPPSPEGSDREDRQRS